MPRGLQHDIFAVGTAKFLNGCASFFIRIYTVRFLDPAGYGVLSFGLNSLMLFDALVGVPLDLGAMALLTAGKPCEDRDVQRVEKAAIRLKLAFGAALLVAFALAGEWLGHLFLHRPGGRSFFLVLVAGGIAILLVRSVQLYYQARLRFRVFGAIDILHSALRVGLVGVVLYAGAAAAVPILGCYAIAALLVVAVFFPYGRRWTQHRPTRADDGAVLRSTGPILASVAAGSVVSRLDMFLVAMRGTPVQLGLYGAALTLATIPEIIGAYLSPIFLPRILPARKAGTFRAFFRRFHLVVFAVAGAALLIGAAAGPWLLGWVLPERYGPSIALVRIMLPGTLAAAAFLPLTLNFLMLTSPRTFLIVDTVAMPALAALYFFLVPVHGALAAAWITCVHRFAKAVIVQARAYSLSKA